MRKTKASALHPYVRAQQSLNELPFGTVTPAVTVLTRTLYGIIDRLERKNRKLQDALDNVFSENQP